MPLIGTRGAASARGFGMFNLSVPKEFFLGTYNSAGQDLRGCVTCIDTTNGDVYVAGRNANNSSIQIIKYNTLGVIQWQRELNLSSSNYYFYGNPASNPSDIKVLQSLGTPTVWIAATAYNTTNARYEGIMLSIDGNTTAVNYCANYYSIDANAPSVLFNKIVLSVNTGDTFVAAKMQNDSTLESWFKQLAVAKTSGNISNQLAAYGDTVGTPSAASAETAVLSPSGNSVYFIGYTRSPASASRIALFIWETNTSLNFVARRYVDDNTGNKSLRAYDATVDSSGNLYICGTTASTGLSIKINSSYAIQWQYDYITSGTIVATDKDSSNNIYLCMQEGGSRYNFVKITTAGAITWQRALQTSSSGLVYPEDIFVVPSTGNFSFNGRADPGFSGINRYLFGYLSGAGTGTGTYSVGGTSYVYQTGSMSSSATTTYTISTFNPGQTNGTVLKSTISASLTTPSYTSSVTQL